MNSRIARVIVCGTGFGNFYLRAIDSLKGKIELKGILSKGSDESKKYSLAYGVPLYTSVDEIPTNIDFVCLVVKSEVMGGEGEKIAKQLFKKGINVIMEHPISYTNVIECLKESKKYGVNFKISNLYLNLDKVRSLIQYINDIKENILEIDIECSSRVSFPLIHLLAHILPSLRPLNILDSSNMLGVNQIILGSFGKIPFLMKVNHEIDKLNPESYMRMFFSISVTTETGRIRFEDIQGPLLYSPTLYIPFTKKTAIDIQKGFSNYLNYKGGYIGDSSISTFSEMFDNEWPKAISKEIIDFVATIFNKEKNLKALTESQKVLSSIQCWQEISKTFNEFNVIENQINYKKNTNNSLYLNSVEVEEYLKKLDIASYETILNYFQNKGFFNTNQFYPVSDILKQITHQNFHVNIIKKWLVALEEAGYIKFRAGSYSKTDLVHHNINVSERWDKIINENDERICSNHVIQYFKENALNIEKLFLGDIKATHLLFPKGDMKIADELYSNTYISKYLNKEIFKIVANKYALIEPNKMTILELGAGTGATTTTIINGLNNKDKRNFEYTYTDISLFFQNKLSEKYKNNENIIGKILNIDESFVNQGITRKYDIVIAAGVLNNCKQLDETLRNIQCVMKKGAYLIITEPTKEFPEMMISQLFMMEKSNDIRRYSQTMFLSEGQWQDYLKKSGFKIELVLPSEKSLEEKFGQHLFFCKKKVN